MFGLQSQVKVINTTHNRAAQAKRKSGPRSHTSAVVYRAPCVRGQFPYLPTSRLAR